VTVVHCQLSTTGRSDFITTTAAECIAVLNVLKKNRNCFIQNIFMAHGVGTILSLYLANKE